MYMSKFQQQPVLASPILVDVREAARLLCISQRTLWTLTNGGEIPSLKIGRCVRYRLEDLNKFALQRTSASTDCSETCNGNSE